MNKALTTTAGPRGLQMQSYDDMFRFAETIIKAGMAPKDCKNAEDALVRIQMGAEIGLTPMQSVQSISNIGGRPSVWGDALIGVVLASPVCEDIQETFEGEGDALTAVCKAKRKGHQWAECRFSVADAKQARLWGKGGPWTNYPRRMLQNRARQVLRDKFADVLKGLITGEEARDYPEELKKAQPVEVVNEFETHEVNLAIEPEVIVPDELQALRERWAKLAQEHGLTNAALAVELQRIGYTGPVEDAPPETLAEAITGIEESEAERTIEVLEEIPFPTEEEL